MEELRNISWKSYQVTLKDLYLPGFLTPQSSAPEWCIHPVIVPTPGRAGGWELPKVNY